MITDKEKVKPDIEWFFDAPYKGFCGDCGHMLWCGGKDLENIKKELNVCHWCGKKVDWNA